MSRQGRCSCGAVAYAIDGPVRDAIVCHCADCLEAAGSPWAASAVARRDLTIAADAQLQWVHAPASHYEARRGFCRRCGDVVFWDAPGLETVSFGVSTLCDSSEIEVAAHIWAGDDAVADADPPSFERGRPDGTAVRWHPS
jgi:hypothetical protein